MTTGLSGSQMSKDWRPRQGEPVVPGGRQEDGGCNLDDQTLEPIAEVGGLGTTVHGAGTAAQASGRSVGVDGGVDGAGAGKRAACRVGPADAAAAFPPPRASRVWLVRVRTEGRRRRISYPSSARLAGGQQQLWHGDPEDTQDGLVCASPTRLETSGGH